MNGGSKPDDLATGPELTLGAVLPSKIDPLAGLAPPRGPGELGWFGEYRVLKLLGIGGMGVVYEAEDVGLCRRVALKILRPELIAGSDGRARFLREARAAASLSSEFVITVFRVGEEGGIPYLVMELLPGESLQDRLDRTPRIDTITALTVVRQAATGLAVAHAQGLVHRDIKPANLFLESDGPGGPFKRVRILDFGIVRRVKGESSLTSTGFIVGTPHFMAPEQAESGLIDHRADLFSLGAVLYTALTGEMPFPGDSAIAVLMSLATRVPPPVTQRNPAVPVAVSTLISSMLAKEPANRPQSAQDLVATLDAMLSKLPPRSPTPPGGNLSTPYVETVDATSSLSPTTRAPAPPRARRISRRTMLRLGGGATALGGLGVAGWYAARQFLPGGAPVRVGILHSQTGTMAVSEGPVIDATMLAIEELNHSGGILGRRISPVVGDGKSDPAVFAAEAERLIRTERVAVIFGCWTSASRKAVRTVVERHDGLLFYPIQYEGLEESPRIVYLGPTPNQQLLPGLDYLTGTLGKRRLFFVGSDYVFPHAAHAIALDWLKRSPNVEVVGTEYLTLGTKAVAEVVKRIRSVQPDAILNTINGGTNFDFFRELRTNGQHSSRVPTLSVSITENELRGIDPATVAGDFLAASYFQTVARAENREFIAKVQARYGAERTTSDGMAAAYTGVRLWAQSVAAARTPEPAAVTEAVAGQEFNGPSGRIRIDRENRNAWRPWRIGQVQLSGAVAVVEQAPESVRPEPFPPTRSRAEWERFLAALNQKWNGRWQPPDAP